VSTVEIPLSDERARAEAYAFLHRTDELTSFLAYGEVRHGLVEQLRQERDELALERVTAARERTLDRLTALLLYLETHIGRGRVLGWFA
jgi:hypothetical protein